MSLSFNDIRAEFKTLTQEDREDLLEAIEFDLYGEPPFEQEEDDIEVANEWRAEIEKRASDIDSGIETPISHEEFMEALNAAGTPTA